MRLFFLTLSVSLVTAAMSQAADIRVLSPGTIPVERVMEGECSIQLSGVIEKGDAQELERILDTHFTQEHGEYGEALCLDSPGGSLEEGVNIAGVLGRHYTATVVPAGATCLSACAVAFMGGNTAWYEFWYNARMMHSTATLGFHAPSLEVPQGAYDQQTVEKAFNIAISAIGRIADELSITMHSSTVPQFPKSLFGAMLQHHGSDFVYVDTVELAATWDIRVLGARSKDMDHKTMELACFSAERWLTDQPVFDFVENGWILEEDLFSEIERTGDDSWQLTYGEMFVYECLVERYGEGFFNVKLAMDGTRLGEGTYGGWAAFPPNTQLSSLN